MDPHLFHLVGNGMASVASKAINARAYQEMDAELMCEAEQFIDIALSITNMHAAIGSTAQDS